MNRNKVLNVLIGEQTVGTLAETPDHRIAFEYDADWLRNGFSISPYSLPLQAGVFLPKGYDPFEGLFGVFADSLPDGWGRLLVDRLLLKEKMNPMKTGALTRLAIVGDSGMGALSYRPESRLGLEKTVLSLDEIALQCTKMFDTNETDNLDELFRMGGSSGGARPKIFYQMDQAEWIVKFPSSLDPEDIGLREYEYSLCAKACEIDMPETRLLRSEEYSGYFAIRRFDRAQDKRIHMISVSALLETTHRIPNLDYHILMQLVMGLTNDYKQVEQMYRRMCFNVFAHNRDDHSKNFSFLYDTVNGCWKLSPAYDLTYSNSIGGEHATTVDGNGMNPGMKELLAVAKRVKMDSDKARRIAEEIQEIVHDKLIQYNDEV